MQNKRWVLIRKTIKLLYLFVFIWSVYLLVAPLLAAWMASVRALQLGNRSSGACDTPRMHRLHQSAPRLDRRHPQSQAPLGRRIFRGSAHRHSGAAAGQTLRRTGVSASPAPRVAMDTGAWTGTRTPRAVERETHARSGRTRWADRPPCTLRRVVERSGRATRSRAAEDVRSRCRAGDERHTRSGSRRQMSAS